MQYESIADEWLMTMLIKNTEQTVKIA